MREETLSDMEYAKILSANVQDIKPSGIRKFFDMLSGMDDVVGLTVGEPDFVTPWHIRVAGIESLEKGKTYYTANAGLADLRREIAAYLERRFDLRYDPATEIVVTVGGSEAIDLTMRALIEPGDEVIVPQPSFVCYGPIAELAHGKPVFIETKEADNFKLTAAALRAAITEKTKLLVLPFPNNPTGAVMTREDLTAIAEVLEGTNIMVLSDEIYGELTYNGHHVSPANIPGMRERTIVTSGFSKAYAMTGWRLGYLTAPAPLAKQMLKIHQSAIMSGRLLLCVPEHPAVWHDERGVLRKAPVRLQAGGGTRFCVWRLRRGIRAYFLRLLRRTYLESARPSGAIHRRASDHKITHTVKKSGDPIFR